MLDFLPGVTSHTIETDRLNIHYLSYGSEDGIPVVLIHGNLATGRFFEHLMPNAPEGYRFLMPDMRGFGDTERVRIDSTRGLRDWADDAYSLVRALGIDQPVHLAGWSTGGAAIAVYAIDRPRAVASLTFIDPVSPYGFGGTHLDGTPCAPDWSGSGGGTGNPEFAERLAANDRTTESPLSPHNVIAGSYWSPDHTESEERMAMLVDEVLKSETGDDGYPGDFEPSDNWPGVAPGKGGILNALSGKYSRWEAIADIDPKPPVLWVHGTADIVVADGSPWEMGTLGQMELVPGWPGEEAFPPQQMVAQIGNVLGQYSDRGGSVKTEMFEGSGHGPMFDAAEAFSETFFGFLTH